MGRSRITRTFHNKPKPTIRVPNRRTESPTKNKPKYKPSKSTQSKGLIPQAHAQEPKDTPTDAHKSRTAKIKTGRGSPNPLGLFAQGVGNQAHDIGGSVHGLVTGQDYQVKSVLNRSLEHAFAGDWDSAGKIISDNPYRFAGNVATEAGLAIIPFGMVARGAGIAGKVGSAVSKSRKAIGKTKGKRKAMKAIKQEEKRIGRKFTKNERRNIMDETPTMKDVNKKSLLEVSKGDTNTSYWSTPAYNRSNIGAHIPIERWTDPIKSSSSHVHKRISTLDQAYIQKGLPGSKIPSEFVQRGEFGRLRAATGLPENQFMMMSSKYPVPNSVINKFNKGGLVRGNDNKKVKSLFYYKSQFTPENPFH